MTAKHLIAGGCSFTFGHELSDDVNGTKPSRKTWAYNLMVNTVPTANDTYVCTAYPGSGNSGIARRVYTALDPTPNIRGVIVMWSFNSRYDWAMPRHKLLEKTRWASISPWDTNAGNEEAFRAFSGSEAKGEKWKSRQKDLMETGVRPFSEAIYKYGANEYHETYLSWKSIIWLQNILEKRKIPFMFTLADNSLFYRDFAHHKEQDSFMESLHKEIDFTKWYFFGERCMGFNQWARLNDYEIGTTHPLDKAHSDATMLMLPMFKKLIGE